jgi:hypothetical protein
MTRLELERERALVAALRDLARDLKEPSFDPQREQELLAIFDQARARPRAHMQAPVWTGLAAAALLVGAVLTWPLTNGPGAPGIASPPTAVIAPDVQHAQTLEPGLPIAWAEPPAASPVRAAVQGADVQSPVSSDVTEFVAWPGAAAWPPFESGELIRVELSVDGDAVVEADVLVGQDGFARAVRLVR